MIIDNSYQIYRYDSNMSFWLGGDEYFYYEHNEHNDRYRPMTEEEILHCSKNKENLEEILTAKKYNL